VNGGYYDPVPASFYANGRTVPEPKAGDAPRDALAYMSIGYNAQLFLSAMIFDGVLDRFKGLRIGVVELGAVWFASWVRQLDQAHRAFKRLQDLPELSQVPSAYAYERIKITPFAGEPIGWMLAQEMDEVLMFASDYPHHEGTDDPIGRFERAMPEASEGQRDRFYRDNYKALFALS
jgi:predicted TIM-barrel fold metal-dependent hydrolase